MRPLERRLRELESVPHPNADDYARLLTLASDMEDEIDRLRDMVQAESTRACELRERLAGSHATIYHMGGHTTQYL